MTFRVANVICSFNSASGGPPRTVSLIARAGLGHWRAELFTTDAVGLAPDLLLTPEFPGHVNLLPGRAQAPFWSALMALGISRAYEAQLLHGVAPNLIHIHGAWSPFLFAFASSAFRHRIPYIFAPHGMLEPWSLSAKAKRKSLALKTYQGQLIARAAAIHATSNAEAENLRCLPCVRSPIFVIPNAVDEPSQKNGERPVAAERQKTLLFLSRVHKKKGLDLLLQAWKRLRPIDWTLLIVGNGQPAYVEQLKHYCITEQLSNVEFYPHVDADAREAMFNRAAALVLPTFSENFGNVVAEAMIRGLPVVTTTGTPWSEIVDRRLGWYVEPKIEALQQALSELFSTPTAQLQEMGERARRYALDCFSTAAVRDRLLEMYNSVLRAGMPNSDPLSNSPLSPAASSS